MPLSMKRYLIALDPGQKQDPAAVQIYKAVPDVIHPDKLIQQEGKIIYRDNLVMQYRYADKRYTYLVEQILNIMQRPSLSSESILVFDATGVGAAVKDMFVAAGVKDMIPIVYTAGGKVSYVWRDEKDERFRTPNNETFRMRTLDELHVPKADMVDAARLELERQAVKIVKNLPYKDDFEKQLLEFRGKMNQKGYTSYNNSKDEIHDDWVNCFMMRSFIRRFYRSEIYKEEKTYTAYEDTVTGLKAVLGERAENW